MEGKGSPGGRACGGFQGADQELLSRIQAVRHQAVQWPAEGSSSSIPLLHCPPLFS